ncbi:class I adenylate-forming enzyme family protein [Bacillus cereus]|uniref:class I adenylate-forming enzyme family protein n=1 Tax=Bacillus cereus TaxID=1396 RepID=UPI00384A9394
MKLNDFFLEHCDKYGEKTWISYKEENFTFNDVKKRVIELSDYLQNNLGINRKERIGVLIQNPVENIICQFALIHIEAIPVLFHKSSMSVVKKICEHNGMDRVITDNFQLLELIGVDVLENNKNKYEEVAICFPTSGTSATPKIVMLSDNNILNNLNSVTRYMNIESLNRVLVYKSLSHVSTFTGEILLSLKLGANIFFLLTAYSPKILLKSLKKYNVDFFTGVSTSIRQLSLLKHDALNNVKYVTLLGEPISHQDVELTYQLFPKCNLFIAYGQTEASPRISCLLPTEIEYKRGSVGKAIEGVEINIRNDDGELCRPFELGNITIKGDNVMLGYMNHKSEFINGELWTGDLGYLDVEGYLFVKGRKQDCIYRAGEKIFPIKIENIFMQHPAIKDVIIYGYKNPKSITQTTKIHARVELKNKDTTVEELYEYCRKNLVPFEVPDLIILNESIPKNKNGKKIRKFMEEN